MSAGAGHKKRREISVEPVDSYWGADSARLFTGLV